MISSLEAVQTPAPQRKRDLHVKSRWQTSELRRKTTENLFFSCKVFARPRPNYNHTAQYPYQLWCSSDPAKLTSLAKSPDRGQELLDNGVIAPSQSSYVPVPCLSVWHLQIASIRACTYPRYRARQPITALFFKHSTGENTATFTYPGFS